jgi:cell division protein FtsB
MYLFLLFSGVALVWLVVLALLAKRLWGQFKALTRELAAAQSKLAAAQRPQAGSTGVHQDARVPA